MSHPSTLPAASPAKRTSDGEERVHLYLAGVGSVGHTLLRQLAGRPPSGVQLQVIGACTEFEMVWNEDPTRLPLDGQTGGDPTDWSAILPILEKEAPRPLIVVDATGSLEVARLYERLLRAGIHVVTPSKIANTLEQDYFDRLRAISRSEAVHYRYETTVGAGLPVVQVVEDLIATGDRIHSIRGVVSGTLSYLFYRLRQRDTFSHAIKSAKAKGYTEPDVRDDLSGEDVVRKFMTLVRTAGVRIEREAVEVETLVPPELRHYPADAFLKALADVDAAWSRRVAEANEEGAVLQYVGQFDEEGIRIGVRAVEQADALARLRGTDNLIEFYTDRYSETPIVVQGPGAGPEVTAAGVLADLLKVAHAVAGKPA